MSEDICIEQSQYEYRQAQMLLRLSFLDLRRTLCLAKTRKLLGCLCCIYTYSSVLLEDILQAA